MRKNDQSQTCYEMPAGTYYIGDIGYAFNNDWYARREALGVVGVECFEYSGNRVVEFELDGDGLYRGSDGNQYPVDTASIGIIRAADLTIDVQKEYDGFTATYITFPVPFAVYRDKLGLHFGDRLTIFIE